MSDAPAPAASPRPWMAFVVSLVASTLVLALLLVSDGRVLELRKVRQETHQLDLQIEALRRENDTLRASIDAANRHGFPIEKVAREELHLVHPDDVVLLYPKGSLSATKGPSSAPASVPAQAARP
jgi:cell division protein FtsB